jgi:predicted dehydrogenase
MTLRIGILGAARVATYAMVGAARDITGVTVQAVAARDPARARAYADEHGIAQVFPDYQALIDADTVDAVYVALPPNVHARWSIAALAAGKPVLCEKPFALSLADAEAMVAAETALGGLVIEAQHSHYHPLSAFMRDMVQSGDLGTITAVEAIFCGPVPATPGELRFDRTLGGGALWDLGIYPAYWARSALAEVLTPLTASQRWVDDDPERGADIATDAVLQSASGARIILRCAMNAPLVANIKFTGSRGWLDIRNPLAPQRGHSCRWETGGQIRETSFDAPTTYAAQLAQFRDAVQHGDPVPTRGADTLATMRLLAAIDTLARQGAPHAD